MKDTVNLPDNEEIKEQIVLKDTIKPIQKRSSSKSLAKKKELQHPILKKQISSPRIKGSIGHGARIS